MKKFISPSVYFILWISVLVLAAVFLILGPNEKQDQNKFPVAQVTTAVPSGYTSSVTEQHVTEVLEKQISQIKGVSSIESVSTGTGSSITVFSETEGQELFYEIRKVVKECERQLPQNVLPPVIMHLYPEEYLLLYTVDSKVMSSGELRHFHEEEILPQVNTLSEILYTSTLGGKQKVLRICPDLYRLAAFGLSFQDVYQCLSREQLNLSTSLKSLTVTPSYLPEDIRNMVIHDQNNQAYRIGDLCKISGTEEPAGSFSGRQQEAGKVTGLIHYRPRENESEETARRKIIEHLNRLQFLSHKGITILPFETGSFQQKTSYPAAKKAIVIGAIGFLLLLLISFFAEMAWKKKTLVLVGTALFFTAIIFILHQLQPLQEEETLHFVLKTGTGDEEQKENLAGELARKTWSENNLQDLAWYSGEKGNDPSEKNSIHFYARLKPGVDREKVLEQLYAVFGKVPGCVLTQFPSRRQTPSLLCTIKVKGGEDEACRKTLDQLRQKLENLDVEDLFTKGNDYEPLREYRLAGNVQVVQEERTITDRKNGMIIKIGCLDANGQPVNEILVRDMNLGGKLVPVQPVYTTVLSAIYHLDREKIYYVGFSVEEERLDRIRQELEQIQVEPGVKVLWEK